MDLLSPMTGPGCCSAAGCSGGSAQPPAWGVSHFTLQRWLNNVAAHQRAEQGWRDVGEDDHGTSGKFGLSLAASRVGQEPSCGSVATPGDIIRGVPMCSL